MTMYLRAFAESTIEDSGPIRFVASTEGVARDGMVIESSAWNLENYRRNPVVLWGHDYVGRTLPIGRADVRVEGGQLLADVVFDSGDPFAAQVERKYRAGFLHAVSVGWDTQQAKPGRAGEPARVTRADLLDISAVPVPADPNALMARGTQAARAITEWLEELTTNDSAPEGETLSYETAGAMLDLFTTRVDDPDRESKYRALLPEYRRAGATAPELLDAETVKALGPAELRGLFLANEPACDPERFASVRVGAVLNARNRERLGQAVELIQAVIDSAEKTQPSDTESAKAEPRAEEPDYSQVYLEFTRTMLNIGGLK